MKVNVSEENKENIADKEASVVFAQIALASNVIASAVHVFIHIPLC